MKIRSNNSMENSNNKEKNLDQMWIKIKKYYDK